MPYLIKILTYFFKLLSPCSYFPVLLKLEEEKRGKENSFRKGCIGSCLAFLFCMYVLIIYALRSINVRREILRTYFI